MGADLSSTADYTEFCLTSTMLRGEFRVSEPKSLVLLAWPCSKLFSDQNKPKTILFCTDIISYCPFPLVWQTWSTWAKHLLPHQHLPPAPPGAQFSAPDRPPPPPLLEPWSHSWLLRLPHTPPSSRYAHVPPHGFPFHFTELKCQKPVRHMVLSCVANKRSCHLSHVEALPYYPEFFLLHPEKNALWNYLDIDNYQYHVERNCVCVRAYLCPTVCSPMDYSLPGSSVHRILQARVPVWADMLFSRGCSRPRDQPESPVL